MLIIVRVVVMAGSAYWAVMVPELTITRSVVG